MKYARSLVEYLSSYPEYLRVPHWNPMGLPGISRVIPTDRLVCVFYVHIYFPGWISMTHFPNSSSKLYSNSTTTYPCGWILSTFSVCQCWGLGKTIFKTHTSPFIHISEEQCFNVNRNDSFTHTLQDEFIGDRAVILLHQNQWKNSEKLNPMNIPGTDNKTTINLNTIVLVLTCAMNPIGSFSC